MNEHEEPQELQGDGGTLGRELADELLQAQAAEAGETHHKSVKPSRKAMRSLAKSAVLGGMYTWYLDRRIAGSEGEAKPLDLRLIDRLAGRKLGKTTEVSPVSPEDEAEVLEDVEMIYKDVWRWHGTGRYQHRNGEVTDILQEMIRDGGMKPHPDKLDPVAGEMLSISTSPSRMYARPYADMHHDRDQPLSYRYGKASKWAKYFMAPYPIEAAMEAKLWRKEVRGEFRKGAEESMVNFQGKVSEAPESENSAIYDMLDEGSDIPGNYPVVAGFREGAFEDVVQSEALARYESRSGEFTPWERLTHLEVPLENIKETRRMLEEAGQINIPVIPLELGEYYCSKFDFTELVAGKPLELSKKSGDSSI